MDLPQRGRHGNHHRDGEVLDPAGPARVRRQAECQASAPALQPQEVDHVVVGRHRDGPGRGADDDLEEGAGLDGRVVARLAPVLRDAPPAAREHARYLSAAHARRALDVRADLSLGVVEQAYLLGREHLGEAVHVVALDLRHGGDVGQPLLEGRALRRLARNHRIGHAPYGAVERLAVGLVDGVECLDLFGREVQFADHLLAGGGVQLLERLALQRGGFDGVDGGPDFGDGPPHLPVTGCSPGTERQAEGTDQNEKAFHGIGWFRVAGCRRCRRNSPRRPAAASRPRPSREVLRCRAPRRRAAAGGGP